MNCGHTYGIIGRRRLRSLVAGVLCLVAAACTRMQTEELPAPNPAGGEALVRLTVSVPRPAVLRATRDDGALEAVEGRIAAVRVLVFEQSGGRYLYRYMTEGEPLPSGGGMQFEARLSSSSNPVKLLLAANYGDAFDTYVPAAGSDEATVRTQIGRSFAGLTELLPMYGEATLPEGLRAGDENRVEIRMLRAVARADVRCELTAGSRPFRIASLALYRPADKLRIIPDGVASAEAPRVTAPSVFAGAQRLTTPVTVDPAAVEDAAVEGLYLPEAEAVSDPAAQLSEAMCLVVGGYYDGQSQPTYYRIDFDSGADGHPFGQVLRNYKYVFRILKVTGAGWSTPDEAATRRATSLVAEVEVWEDFMTGMYFEGESYLGISSRSVTLGYLAAKSRRIDVQASIPYTVQWLDAAGQPVGEAVTGVGASTANDAFTVTIGRDAGDGETLSYLRFTAATDNRTDSDRTATLRVSGGRWHFDVAVTQETSARYRQRIVRVLSVDEIGDLGGTDPAGASGLALRRILGNTTNFSATGKVIVGGFSFTELSRADLQLSNTASERFRSVRGILAAQDVIYLTYNTVISNELAQVVLAWLGGSTGRVLIVGTDTESTNANLRSRLTSDGTWKYYVQGGLGGGFKRAARTEANARFFTGPFGAVADNAPIAKADNYAGYCASNPVSVTPLVVSDVAGQERTFIVGVNLAERIVYHGDANLNQSGSLSAQANSDGTVTSDFDRLTANLWAWIVEVVCDGG